jgi:LL-diaminopimelate aminotransferase
MVKLECSQKIRSLPPYLFAELDRVKQSVIDRGKDVINLGVGDPELPTPPHIVKALQEAVLKPSNHRYPSYRGLRAFREAAQAWMKKRFGVEVNPESEIVTLIGSKEGIFHTPLAFLNQGDIALVPSPGYPVYQAAVIFAGGKPYPMPLLEKNNFLPSLTDIPKEILKKAKLLFINYPNNPTGATAEKEFFEKFYTEARKYEIIICHDAAYSELGLGGYKAPSFLEVEEARGITLEFHSLSKTFNMTGWRIGFAVGGEKLIKALSTVKENADSGVFQAVQEAAICALQKSRQCIIEMKNIYEARQRLLCAELKKLGWRITPPRATFYLWVKIPFKVPSLKFARFLLEEAGVVVTPGVGFGDFGEGYIRFALTVSEERLKEAVKRIKMAINKMPL